MSGLTLVLLVAAFTGGVPRQFSAGAAGRRGDRQLLEGAATARRPGGPVRTRPAAVGAASSAFCGGAAPRDPGGAARKNRARYHASRYIF